MPPLSKNPLYSPYSIPLAGSENPSKSPFGVVFVGFGRLNLRNLAQLFRLSGNILNVDNVGFFHILGRNCHFCPILANLGSGGRNPLFLQYVAV